MAALLADTSQVVERLALGLPVADPIDVALATHVLILEADPRAARRVRLATAMGCRSRAATAHE